MRSEMIRYGVSCLLAIAFWLGGAFPASAQEPARLLLLAPSDEQIGAREELPGDFLIAISIIDPAGQIDLSSIRLFVDEIDVTTSATVTSAVVTYIPEPPLPPGRHRFDLRLKDIRGQDLPGLRRDVQVEGLIREEPDWGIGGRVILNSITDDLSGPGTALRQEPENTNTARVRLGGHLGEWEYGGTLFLTSDEEDASQPRNRYALHLDRDWIGLDVGDINYTFSPMVLRGKRTRGVGGYVRLGNVELTALRGSIRRGIEGEIQTDSTGVDTLSISGSSYERNLVGARLAVGTGRTFQLAFDGIRVRDDVNSIAAGILPKDNLVFGSSVLYAPFKRRLILDATVALSLITEDITGGALSEGEIEDLVDVNVPFNPVDFEDIFIMNLSTSPLDPRDRSSVAVQGGIRGNLRGHVFEGRFQQIGPSFASLAAPSIQSDKRGFRATDSFRLIDNRLRISGELEHFEDNLNDDKDFTTDTQILGVTTSFLPGWAGLEHVTLSYRLYGRENDAPAPAMKSDPDLRVDDQTTTVRLGSGYRFRCLERHRVSANYMHSETDALNPSADATQTDWILGWTTRFEGLPLMVELAYGENDADYPFTGTQVKYSTRRARGSYDFLESRLETHASITQVTGDSNVGIVGGDKRTVDAGARYRLARRTYLSGSLSLVKFSDEVDPGNDYEETVLTLRLLQDF